MYLKHNFLRKFQAIEKLDSPTKLSRIKIICFKQSCYNAASRRKNKILV